MKTLCGVLCILLLTACGSTSTPVPAPPIGTPVPTSVVVVATPILTRPPAPTPNTRTQWPPNLKDFVSATARVVDASEVDTDGDGVSELLVIYQEDGVGRGMVIRREGERGTAYALGGEKPSELFRESWTANTVRDVNGDGRVEIMIEGVQRGTATTLNIFQWNGRAYVSLLALTGSQGIAIDDAHNTGIVDFTALQLLFERSAIMRATHAEWQKTAYDVTSDVLFLLGVPAQFNYPEEPALAYYLLLHKDEPEEMFRLLAEPQRSKTPLNVLLDLSRSVDSVGVEVLKVDEEKADSATVSASIRYVDHATQRVQTTQHIWRVKKVDGQWRLAERVDKSPW